MTRLTPIAIVLTLVCGCGARPASSAGETLDVVMRLHEIPAIPPDVAPSIRAEVVLLGLGGIAVGQLDLGAVGVDASSCATTDPSAIEGAIDLDDPARAPRVELACSGVDTGWRVALIDRGDRVEIWTLLRDEAGGSWQAQPDLALPERSRARLHGEPDVAP
jgi:hypothetical protein